MGLGVSPGLVSGLGFGPDPVSGLGLSPDLASGLGLSPDPVSGLGLSPDLVSGLGERRDLGLSAVALTLHHFLRLKRLNLTVFIWRKGFKGFKMCLRDFCEL